MILPQLGKIEVVTELGILEVEPLEMLVIPRGLLMQINKVESWDESCKGYFLENFGCNFELPELGPIGISAGL